MKGTEKRIATSDTDSDVIEYTIENDSGMKITALSFGATLNSLFFNNRPLLITFNELSDIITVGSYVGSTVGRVANRIRGATFNLNNKVYATHDNFSGHTLHGGAKGFSYIYDWTGSIVEEDDWIGVRLNRVSPHLEEGFPGTVTVDVWYKLTAQNDLIIEFYATTDTPTILNLTNHAYWNLNGGGHLGDHIFFINANQYLVTDEDGIFDGVFDRVDETLDFTTPRPAVVQGVEAHYDLSYVVNRHRAGDTHHPDLPVQTRYPELPVVGCVYNRHTAMLVSSTYPTVQLFVPYRFPVPPVPDNFVNNGSFCLECQMHLDAHRFPHIPSTILQPDQNYHHKTIHQFYSLNT